VRSVLLVTRHADVAALAPALERAALSADVRAPEQLALDAGNLAADAIVLDLRDVPAAAFDLLVADATERGVVFMALLPPEQLDRIPVGVDVDDFGILPVEAAELARRIERALWRRHGIDTLILGCTHYERIAEQVGQIMGPAVTLIHEGQIVADRLQDYLFRHSELSHKLITGGERRFCYTSNADVFSGLSREFYGSPITAEEVTLR